MKRINVLSAALVVATIAGSAVANAQDSRGRRADPREQHPSHDQQAQPRAQAAPQHVQQAQADPRLQRSQQAQGDPRLQRTEQAQADPRFREGNSEQYRNQSELRAQQEYAQRAQRQEEERLEQLRVERNYDPYIANRYRFNVGGVYRETNEYGANALRQAVNNGYLEGVRAGQRDRADRWAPDFRRALAYQNGDFGFSGSYVDRSDYTYYFRQGFERGYDDGYYGRSQYGSYLNGGGSILGNVLTGILGLELVR